MKKGKKIKDEQLDKITGGAIPVPHKFIVVPTGGESTWVCNVCRHEWDASNPSVCPKCGVTNITTKVRLTKNTRIG